MRLKAFAPAKINLFLHVGPLQSDGYHPLSSWMVFADVGDSVSLSFGEEPMMEMGFEVTGPMAQGVPVSADNLVLKARDGVLAMAGDTPDFCLTLDKHLPPASGIGGGSSDAAATLRLLSDVFDVPFETITDLAPQLGADVPACLKARSLIAQGRGEILSTAPNTPALHAVLVNPGVAVSTGAVFRLYDQGEAGGSATPEMPATMHVKDLVGVLRRSRNDLEASAIRLQPVIGEVLAALRAAPQTAFTRMSGSGATCFALTHDQTAAQALARRIAIDHPDWWVHPCRLGGPWPDDFTSP